MERTNAVFDLVIIGAGPSGLACAIEAEKNDLSYLVIEKGCLVHSIFRFPTNITLFSTPDLLEIGGIPFTIATEKPKRTDLLNYYRRVAEYFDLNIRLFERVEEISGRQDNFEVVSQRATYHARNLVLATGQYDNPNWLGVPGERLPKVSHYYTEAHPYYRRRVAVIGGKNSAVEAALELYRHGADVTLIHRGPTLGESVKYWIRPDIENRIKENKIRAYFNTVVKEIKENSLILQKNDGSETELVNDFVFAMTGYDIDRPFLRKVGIEMQANGTPVHDAETLQTNRAGVYIAGVLTAGKDGSKVFIENSRNHGTKIIGHILNGSK